MPCARVKPFLAILISFALSADPALAAASSNLPHVNSREMLNFFSVQAIAVPPRWTPPAKGLLPPSAFHLLEQYEPAKKLLPSSTENAGEVKRASKRAKTALIFGMGNLARGYLAPLLVQKNGFEVIFAEISPQRINVLNGKKSFLVNPIGEGKSVRIDHVSAVVSDDTTQMMNLGSKVDWVFTSVRAENVSGLARPIGRLIQGRIAAGISTPLNVVIAENLPLDEHQVHDLRNNLFAYDLRPIYRDYVERNVRLVSAIAEITVPDQTVQSHDGLDINVEGGDFPLLMDDGAFPDQIQPLVGTRHIPDIHAYRERKSLIHNLGHAILSYLAAAKGYKDPARAMMDPSISPIVQQAMTESAAALAVKYPGIFTMADLTAYINGLLSRYSNIALGDTVARVARDPIRKLDRSDRFFGALENTISSGLPYEAILFGITAATRYAERELGLAEKIKFVADRLETEFHLGLQESELHFQETWDYLVQNILAGRRVDLLVSHFVDNAAHLDDRPRLSVFDIDRTLIKFPGSPLSPPLAQAFHRFRDEHLHPIMGSGISMARLENDIVPALRSYGPPTGFRFYGGNGAFCVTYDANWAVKTLHYEVSFTQFVAPGIKILLLSHEQENRLIAVIQGIVGPGIPVENHGTHLVCHMPDENDDKAQATALQIERSPEVKGFNEILRQRLVGVPSPWKEHIELRARTSRGGILDVVLVTKDFILIDAQRAIEEETRGVLEADHTLLVDDSLAARGHRQLFNGIDLARAKIGGGHPLVCNVGGIEPRDKIDPHIVTVPDRGPTATLALMQSILEELEIRKEGQRSVVQGPTVDVLPPRQVSLPSEWPVDWRSQVTAYEGDFYRITAQPKSVRSIVPDSLLASRFGAHKPFSPTTRGDSARLRTFWEAAVSAGWIRPIVIVNVKNLYPNARQLYIESLLRLSGHYNGHVTYILVVEDNPYQYNSDYPSVFSRLYQVMACLGDDFYHRPVLFQADGGRKLRNFPITLRYGYQGLIPFSLDHNYLQECFARDGTLLLQMPDFGVKHLVIFPSDGIFNFEQIRLLNGKTLGHWDDTEHLLIPLARFPDSRNATEKVVAGLNKANQVRFVLAKPGTETLSQWQHETGGNALLTLPFVLALDKDRLLHPLITELAHTTMSNGRSFLEYPGDFFQTFVESLYTTNGSPYFQTPGFEKDQATMIALAKRYFGTKGSKISWALLGADDGFTDEGRLQVLRRRARLGDGPIEYIKKDPRVQLGGFHSPRGDWVVLKGRGKLTIGKGVHLRNVLIDLGDGGELTIPDGWIIHDSYLGPDNRFEGSGGYLSGVFQIGEGDSLLPITGQFFDSDHTISTILTQEGEQILVGGPFDEDRAGFEALRFGYRGLRPDVLQAQTDVVRMRKSTEQLTRIIQNEFENLPPVFPLEKEAAVSIQTLSYENWVQALVREILDVRTKGEHYFVRIEGLQGAGKTYLARALSKAFRAEGVNTAVMQEDDFNLKRAEREKLRYSRPSLWRQHRETWHDWDRFRTELEGLFTAVRKRIRLTNLFRTSSGKTDMVKLVKVVPETIFILTGFYLSDHDKLDLPEGPSHQTTIYLGLTPNESLEVKRVRDTWRTLKDVEALDNTIYRPAFAEYHQLFDPASSADIVARINPANRDLIEIVIPARRQAILQERSERLTRQAA